MLGYRRKSFDRVHALLRDIVESPQEIRRVLACQRILLEEISRAEAHISRYKDELRATRVALKTCRPDKSEAQRLKRRVKWIETRIEAYRQVIYIWRCFGDGIAFSYLDKHALKHAFYKTESYAIKQDPGFLSGKRGLANEIALVEAAAEAGIPSILVDLTNSIRHGDVCLLGESDPYLIEVKTGGRLDDRGKRQLADIHKLHAFYETDVGAGLRGFPELRRVAPHVSEHCYVEEINACIDRAESRGSCVVNPEEGLYYTALYEIRSAEQGMFEGITLGTPLAFLLNEYKSNRAWSPYHPFTLSINKPHHLYNFIQGNLFLVVLLDIDVLCRQIAAEGYEVNFENGADYPLRFKDPVPDRSGGISAHFLRRVGLEFLSPNRVVDQGLQLWREGVSATASPA